MTCDRCGLEAVLVVPREPFFHGTDPETGVPVWDEEPSLCLPCSGRIFILLRIAIAAFNAKMIAIRVETEKAIAAIEEFTLQAKAARAAIDEAALDEALAKFPRGTVVN